MGSRGGEGEGEGGRGRRAGGTWIRSPPHRRGCCALPPPHCRTRAEMEGGGWGVPSPPHRLRLHRGPDAARGASALPPPRGSREDE